jgi:hypothetical protein
MKINRIQQEYVRMHAIAHSQEIKHQQKLADDHHRNLKNYQVQEAERILRNRRLGHNGQNVDVYA